MNDRASPTFLDPSAIVVSRPSVPASTAPLSPQSSSVVDVRTPAWSPIPVTGFVVAPTAAIAAGVSDVPASSFFAPVALPWVAGDLAPPQPNKPSTVTITPVAVATTSWDTPNSARSATVSNSPTPLPLVSVTPPAFLPENVSWRVPLQKRPEIVPGVTDSLVMPSTPTVGGPDTPVANHAPKPPPTAQPNVAVFYLKGLPSPEVTVQVSHHGASGTVTTVQAMTVPTSGQLTVIPSVPAVPMQHPTEVVTISVRDAHGLVGQTTQFLKPLASVGDVALFQAYRAGDSTLAFQQLVQRYESFVQRVGERVLRHQSDAQDVGQQVFLELSRYRGEFSGTVSAWLRTVTKNTAISFLRSSRRRLVREQSVAVTEAGQPSTKESLELADALDQLPADVRQAVRLRYLEGYSQQEAAELAGCPRGTLARRASDGVRALRGLL